MPRGLTKEEPLSRIRYLLREVIGFSGLTAWRGLRADGRAAGCRSRAAMTHSAQEFPVRCRQIRCSKVEQGILCKALMSHREKAAPSSKQPPIGRKISQFPVKFAVLSSPPGFAGPAGHESRERVRLAVFNNLLSS